MKKNIYLVQAGCLYGNTYYLPYAVGMLAAFAFNDPRVSGAYELKRMIYRLEDIDESIDSLENPAFMGFSNSIWNYDYNLVYAEKLKARYPDCVIEFGGHHVPPTTEYLEKYPFIDILTHRKGEEAFRDVLVALNEGGSLADIPNISFRDENGNPVQTEEKAITISDYPSPYLGGYFDDILADKRFRYSCVLESNRGCPYNCSYCDWGELNSKVRLFPLEKVLAELEWISAHEMEFVYLVDANFGMFERDEIIARKLVELKNKNGYPNRLQVSYAKAEVERTFRINKLLADNGIGKGATLSLQTLNPVALKNIGRVNISLEQYADQIARYREAGISTYTELILGLPGETKESFCEGLCKILEFGQHSSVSAYYCELLPNSRMSSPEFMKKFDIKTVRTSLNQYHCEVMDDIVSGYSNIVVSTNTMSVKDWVECNEFSVCVQSFHHFGILQCFAMYINKELGVSYYDFYTALYDYIMKKSTFCKPIFELVSNVLNGFVNNECCLTVTDYRFGRITYPLEEAVFLKCLYDSDDFYADVDEFIGGYIKDSHLKNEILRYQRAVVLNPQKSDFTESFDYNFRDYYEAILENRHIPLESKKTAYRFLSPFSTSTWEEYAREIVWYGRRNNRMMFYSRPNTVEKTE